jgi:hypothetical protein
MLELSDDDREIFIHLARMHNHLVKFSNFPTLLESKLEAVEEFKKAVNLVVYKRSEE